MKFLAIILALVMGPESGGCGGCFAAAGQRQ